MFEGEGDDDESKLIEDVDRVKTWCFKKSLNSPFTKAVMATITPHVDMRVVFVYSFSCDIYQGDGGVTEYHKSKSTKGSLLSLAEIKAFIEACGYAACQWIEWMSEKTGKHIHHALCGHGGERQLSVKSGKWKVDGFEPTQRPSMSLTVASGTDVLVNQIEPLGMRSDMLQRRGRKKR